MSVGDLPGTTVAGADATLEGGCRTAAHELAADEAGALAFDCDAGIARVPVELRGRAALREVPHDRCDLRLPSRLAAPAQQDLLVLASIAAQTEFPIHAQCRPQGRESRRFLTQPVQRDGRVELHDDHRAIGELGAVENDGAARRGNGRVQLSPAGRSAAAGGEGEILPILEVGHESPVVRIQDSPLRTGGDPSDLLLGADEALPTGGTRGGPDEKGGKVDARVQRGG